MNSPMYQAMTNRYQKNQDDEDPNYELKPLSDPEKKFVTDEMANGRMKTLPPKASDDEDDE